MKPKNYRYARNREFVSALPEPLDRSDAKAAVADATTEFADLQELLYADDRHALFAGVSGHGRRR